MSQTTIRTYGRRRISGFAIVVVLLVVIVLAALGVFYYFVSLSAKRAASRATDEVAAWVSSCAPLTGEVAEGDVVGVIQLPSLGEQRWPIRYGVTEETLDGAVGWYPDTAAPGTNGNLVIAGYRITHGAPFADLLELQSGDPVVVETCDVVYSYAIDIAPRDLTVNEDDGGWIFADVPGQPAMNATEPLLTLTTSQDRLPSNDRAVGIARLTGATPKGA